MPSPTVGLKKRSLRFVNIRHDWDLQDGQSNGKNLKIGYQLLQRLAAQGAKLRVRLESPKPVPRPVGNIPGPSMAAKKRVVEKKAETAARNKLYRMGYHSVRRLQHDKTHGVDLAAFKYYKSRRPVAGAVVEVKGRGTRTPGPSAFKKQVRASYYEPRVLKAKQAGVKGASDIQRLAKQNRLKSYGATYGLADKGKGARIYNVPRRGPISKKPIA